MAILRLPLRSLVWGPASAAPPAIALALSMATCEAPLPQASTGSGASTTSSVSTGGGGSGSGSGGGGGGGGGGAGVGGMGGGGPTAMYTNPQAVAIPSGGVVENCPDPSVIRGQKPGDDGWYVFCTDDPLNDEDKDGAGNYNSHLIAVLKSTDLIAWTYVGDALTALPSWAQPTSDLWAPDIQFFNGKYHLYYTVTDTLAGGSAIGVATSDSPEGPWTQAAAPAVEPQPAPCCAGSKRWVYDPHVIEGDGGKRYIYYGSYFGGISVRALSDDGASSDPVSQVEVTIPNRYEAAYVRRREGYYYLFGSSTDCCNGPLSGYSVFVGRSKSPFGPFVDRDGVSLSAGRVGGTPVLSPNGNRWVGTGHNALLTDFAGQDWALYHAVDATAPYFEKSAAPGLVVKRHLMMDALDWVDGWPTVRGGRWASDTPQPAPAAQPGQKGGYAMDPVADDQPGDVAPGLSDEFDAAALGPQWSWVRQPAPAVFGLGGGALRFDVQAADLHEDSNDASVLLEAAPSGDYRVEAKVTLDLPAEGCCFNFSQAGLVIYKDDDNYVRLSTVSIWDTRQVEFAKEVGPAQPDYPRFGASVVGSTEKAIWLRIARHAQQGASGEAYTAYTSRDGKAWTRGGTWTHDLGSGARIGLVSMGGDKQGPKFSASFDYIHVVSLKN